MISQRASAVDNLATYYFKHITVGESPTTPAALNLARHVAGCPGVFPEILKTLFEIVLFEDCGNQWSLSRPMLSLILISEEAEASLDFLLHEANEALISAFLVLLRAKGETYEENSFLLTYSKLERGDRIELLVDKTATMQDSAFHFKKQSRRLSRALWMKNAKLLPLLLS
ncbi:hypothetical protein CsSME_00033431 [Camellia sinensis var. sinensis]